MIGLNMYKNIPIMEVQWQILQYTKKNKFLIQLADNIGYTRMIHSTNKESKMQDLIKVQI